MATVTSPLADDAQKITGDALQGSLVDLIDLSLLAKQAHWNLTGPNFRPLHLMLDEVVELARDQLDIMAERAISIGVNPDGRAATIARDTEIEQLDAGYITDEQVVSTFTGILAAIGKRFRERLGSVTEVDPVTENLFEDTLHGLEKMHWMFQVQVQK
ncbi:MAG TPA: DNA starvation/stationary phase protection protein [Streptosporangiaceae bacterium]|jgi:starvation-inducible DNA-binding protein|nr:DNA starvation/stationary phase protection protein [Streptosporangiaceae bacterium]